MVQLVGGVTADQFKPMALEDTAAAVSPVGAEGTVVQVGGGLPLLTASIPLISG